MRCGTGEALDREAFEYIVVLLLIQCHLQYFTTVLLFLEMMRRTLGEERLFGSILWCEGKKLGFCSVQPSSLAWKKRAEILENKSGSLHWNSLRWFFLRTLNWWMGSCGWMRVILLACGSSCCKCLNVWGEGTVLTWPSSLCHLPTLSSEAARLVCLILYKIGSSQSLRVCVFPRKSGTIMRYQSLGIEGCWS